ncbi:protein NLRC5-like isoform X1 [Chanodichthys erythropterus]|uniref:protein NLRC5-like isoform X1 n=1 Tax=Chanodichthys erythropterus TaxID=933992 RepID=UPI00351EA441
MVQLCIFIMFCNISFRLSKCDLTKESCSALAPVLSSDSSDLKDLDLSNNNLEDSGVKLLCDGLKNNCKLEKIRLSNCGITEEGYKALASALRSNPSHLIELDLTGNDPGQSGVKELNDLLQDQNCQLKTLRFLGPDAEEACKYLTGGLHIKNPLLMSELNLSERKLGDTRVKQISALLQDKHCTLNTLMLNNNSITAEGCAALTSAFNSNPSNLIELDLSGNKLGNSGIEEICPLLENTQCRLEKLKLSDCSIREEGYKALASALRSNPSHLIELDLTGNDPGQSGVKELNDLLQNERCKLKIRFLKSPAAQEACDYLTKVLSISPLLLTELDLSEDKLGDLDWEKLSALLMDSHCKVEKIKLNNCDLTEKSCSVLATVLSSKTILKELNLNNSRLLDSGVKQICEGLKNPVCQLEILKLSDCSITEEGYEALASALRSNPSYLIELDLTGNDPGQSGVKELDDLLQDPNCQLKTLRFLDPAADEACQFVTGIVGKNLLLLRELNLSKRELGDTRVNQITALLQDKHCKLNILMLRDCGLTEKSCSALATVLRSNSSLKELDISNNNIMDSGVKKLQNALENTKCTLEKLRLSDCSITEEGYKALASALRSNPSHLIELDLTGNDPGQSGVKELNDLLQDQNCQLKTLRFLSRAADEACQFVNRVLGENLLLLRELNLSENKLGPSGLKKLAAVLPDKHCKLNTLILNNSNITDEDCRVLTEALNSNPSNLTELNLSGTKLRDSGLKIFSAVFKNEQCQLEKLKLNCSSITAESCSVLASALNLNLKELELNENNLGNSGVTEISTLLGNSQCTLKILRLSECSITEEGYKALASALRSNPSHLIELDLTGNDPGQSGVKELNDLLQDQNCQLKTLRFLGPDADEACQYVRGIVGKNPLLLRELNLSKCALGDTRVNQIAALLKDKHCKLNTLMLRDCGLTEESCSALATVLRSNSSLKELDISNNNLQDSGVKKLQNALENTICTLEKLRLSDCSIREEGYKALASALRSNPSHLIELDLTGNDPGQSGVKELNDLLQDQNCQLKTLRFLGPAAYEACQFVTGIVGINPLFLRELNLSGRELGDTRVNQIAALLKDKHCKLNTLMLNNNSITAEGCAALTSAFNSNPSNLIELDLSGNKLGNSGMEKICPLLKNTQCRLEKLKLSDCSISEEGYKALASALRSNTSHLIELDLTGNDPGQSGVKELNDLLQDERYTLKTIRFLKSPAAQEACDYLTKVLGESPLLLTELDLSEDKLGDLDGEKLSALLMDSHSKVEKIKLNNCELTEKSCSVLATVLSSKTILKELNLNNSRLLDSGVKQICEGLKNPVCHLEILKLSDCSISEEGYKALASALRSNPSHLIELDLTGNDPGQSGVKELNDLLQDQNCQLKTLRFLSHAAEEACKYLTEDLHIKNPLLLSELNLSRHELGDTRVNQITALLQDKHCQLNTLILCGCSITENQCHTLTSALFPNLSHLRELDLSGNQIKHTGAKNISDVLKDSRCQLERLRLRNCGLTEESCSALATVLRSNSSLKELDISNNNLQDSGVKKLQNALENTNCTLEKLRLSGCCITEEGYKSLASALRSNPSHLIELDLTGNDPGQSGVKELNDLLQDQNCQLKTLRFLSHAAEEACKYLTEDLHIKNPLLLRELNLSGHELGDTRVNQIAALLQDKHCQLNTLILCGCSITDKQCYTLTSALFPNLSHLRELDLSGNQIKHTGAKNISDVLKDSRCQLERLRLRGCDMKDEGCSAVTSALILNPSHLRELDLSGNKPGDSGFKDLSDLLMNPQCKLENLQLCKCSIKEKQCVSLTSALKSNPSHLRELNLSENKLKHKRLKHFYDLLKDSRCKLERLSLNECGITDVSSLTQSLTNTKALQFLKELDLRKNNIGSSKQQIIDLLQDSSCNLSLEEEGWISTAANVFSSIGGLFTTRSKAQDEPVKSAAQAKPPSDERSSKGTPDHSSEVDKQYEGSAV